MEKTWIGIIHFIFLMSANAQPLDIWIAKNSVVLGDLSEISSTSHLNGLDEIVSNKRLIFLGESDHYVSEKLEYQYGFLKRISLGIIRLLSKWGVGGAYKDLEIFRKTCRDSRINQFLAGLTRSINETREQEIERLRVAMSNVSFLNCGSKTEIRSILQQLIDSLKFISGAYQNPTAKQWLEITAEREKTMMWQMEELMIRKEKVILLGHIHHLSQNSKELNFLPASSGQFQSSWYMIGTYLKERYKDTIYGIWMLNGNGTRGPGPECHQPACDIKILPGTLNSEIIRLSPKNPIFLQRKYCQEV